MPEADLSFAKIDKAEKRKNGSEKIWKNKRKMETKGNRKERQEIKRK